MKRPVLWAAIGLIASGCSQPDPAATADAGSQPEGGQTQAATGVYDARAFFMTTSYVAADSAGHAFNADGSRVLVSSDESGVFNAVAFDLASGEATALTQSETNAVFAVSYFPADERLLYTFDEGGNELNHVFVREADGSVRDLTPGDNVKAGFGGWSADGGQFYLLTNERDGKNFDVYNYATADYARERMFENNAGWDIAGSSRNGRWLALVKFRTSADSDVYVADLKNGGEPTLVTAHQGNVSHDFLTFTPDSGQLYYLTDEFGEFAQAWSYDLATGERALVHADDWDVSFMLFSPAGRYRVTGINADAVTRVQVIDTAGGAPIDLPELPVGEIRNLRFSGDDARLALFVNGDRQPNDLFVIELAAGSARQYTRALNKDIDAADLVEAQVIRYRSFDELEIPAILYRPRHASATRKAPALVLVHGGPGGQTTRGYNPLVQHLVNHGYAILGANNRGSSGYGKTFFHLDDRRHGEDDLKDIVWGRKYLESLDWVDGERIGIIGGSYGGYMVAAALAFHPEAFEVGIDIFGVTNWERTLASIPPWWESFREALYDEMGDPATDQERHRRISPLFHAANIVRPLLVVQGANDPRVLKVESDELVAAVRANEVPVEYVVFDDEGHGFRKRENRIAASNAYVNFLESYLRSNPAAAASSR